jgi:hypothetical protein
LCLIPFVIALKSIFFSLPFESDDEGGGGVESGFELTLLLML